MFYLKIDKTVKPNNKGWGFANTKAVIAFEKRSQRDKALEKRIQFDFSAKKICRTEIDKSSLNEWLDLAVNMGLKQAQDFYLN